MRAGDIAVILSGFMITIMLALAIHDGSPPRQLQVMHKAHTENFSLARDRRVSVNGPLGETLIEIRSGRARVISSPCTGKICIRTGWLEEAGDSTACLPNRVSLALLGDDPRFDAMTY